MEATLALLKTLVLIAVIVACIMLVIKNWDKIKPWLNKTAGTSRNDDLLRKFAGITDADLASTTLTDVAIERWAEVNANKNNLMRPDSGIATWAQGYAALKDKSTKDISPYEMFNTLAGYVINFYDADQTKVTKKADMDSLLTSKEARITSLEAELSRARTALETSDANLDTMFTTVNDLRKQISTTITTLNNLIEETKKKHSVMKFKTVADANAYMNTEEKHANEIAVATAEKESLQARAERAEEQLKSLMPMLSKAQADLGDMGKTIASRINTGKQGGNDRNNQQSNKNQDEKKPDAA